MSATISTFEKLAINGGPQHVTNPPDERWVKVNDDAKRAVMALLDEGTTSLGGRDGIVGEFEDDFDLYFYFGTITSRDRKTSRKRS